MDWLMNNRLYLHLMANREKGFALPLAVLIGLILMVTGMTMIMRSQGDQSKAIAQKVRADALRSSEAGVARVQDLLNSVRVMARFNSNSNCTPKGCWRNAQVPAGNPSNDLEKHLKKLVDAAACSNPDNPNAAATLTAKIADLRNLSGGQWEPLGNNRYYRVVQYNFGDTNPPRNGLGWGVLTLEGRSRTSAARDLTNTGRDIDNDDNAASRNRVVVTIPILNSPPLAFNRNTVPALWISEGTADDGARFQGDVVEVVVSPCNINETKIQQPTTPPNPLYKAQPGGVPFPDLPPIPDGITITNLGNITSSETFPRKNADGVIIDPSSTRRINGQSVQVYEYIVNNINLGDGDKITITPGRQVVFYVRGNINGAIEHNCATVTGCKPGNLQIYANNGLGSTAPQICLRGDQTLQAFIFAPDYSLGKTGTGFTGAAWGKNWGQIAATCPSTSGAVAVTQGVQWADLIADLRPPFPQLGGIDNWCEEPIDTPPGESECD